MRGKLFVGTDDGRVWMTENDGGDLDRAHGAASPVCPRATT